jgi:hypothetical protein
MRYSAESIFVVESNRIEFLREFESIFKTTLAPESGHPWVPFNEKNRGSKISWDCPFKLFDDPSDCILKYCIHHTAMPLCY